MLTRARAITRNGSDLQVRPERTTRPLEYPSAAATSPTRRTGVDFVILHGVCTRSCSIVMSEILWLDRLEGPYAGVDTKPAAVATLVGVEIAPIFARPS
jgi:hypothetical protein